MLNCEFSNSDFIQPLLSSIWSLVKSCPATSGFASINSGLLRSVFGFGILQSGFLKSVIVKSRFDSSGFVSHCDVLNSGYVGSGFFFR